MKNSIKYSKIKYMLALVLLLTGCEDFLDNQPYGGSTSADFWNTEEDLQRATLALYDYGWHQGTTGRGTMYFQNCSDDMVTGRVDARGDGVKNFEMTPSTNLDINQTGGGGGNGAWFTMYSTIAKANSMLGNIGKVNASEASKNRAYGEAYFFRAFSYLWLAPWYADNGPNGGLPIVTEETPVDELDQPRPASVLANYEMIIADFRKAAEFLPYMSQIPQTEYGRAHKLAAWSFAARAALYAAQFDSKYYDTVIEMCDLVINTTGADKRDLFPDFTTLFRRENNFSSEYIFSILGSKDGGGSRFHGMSFQNGGFGYYNTWGYFQPTLELYEAYEPGDTRRDATILSPNQHISFLGHDILWAVSPASVSSTSGMTFRKWMSIFEAEDCLGTVVKADDSHSNELGTVLMRYADVLLMKAEALIWKNGEGNGEAKNLLNQIRKRAGLLENSNASKAELKQERRCELVFEITTSRHLDLVRWGDAKEVYSKPLHGVTTVLKENGEFDRVEAVEIWQSRVFDPTKHHVFPIPAIEVAKSKNLTQNKGY